MLRPALRRSVTLAAVVVPALLLAACDRNPLVVRRSSCPAVAVAAYAGDMTLFRPGAAGAVPMRPTWMPWRPSPNVRDECAETADQFVSRITYDVIVRRTDAAQARQFVLPVFAAVVQAGNIVNAKQISQVTVNFAAGQERAVAQGTASAGVSRHGSCRAAGHSRQDSIASAVRANWMPPLIDGRSRSEGCPARCQLCKCCSASSSTIARWPTTSPSKPLQGSDSACTAVGGAFSARLKVNARARPISRTISGRRLAIMPCSYGCGPTQLRHRGGHSGS